MLRHSPRSIVIFGVQVGLGSGQGKKRWSARILWPPAMNWVGGQEAVLGIPLGGGNKAVDRIDPRAPPFGDLVDNPAFHLGAFEDLVDVSAAWLPTALSTSARRLVELEETALAQVVLQTLAGLGDFFLEMFLMPVQGREAGPYCRLRASRVPLPARRAWSMAWSRGWVADGAFWHGELRCKNKSVKCKVQSKKCKRLSAISGQPKD